MPQSLDILILLVLAVGVVRGFMTGAVRQVLSILGLLIAIILAVELMNPVGALVGNALGVTEALQPALGLLVVFLGIQIVLFFVVRAVETVIKTMRLTTVNRILGGAAGLAKAALVLSLVFIALAHLDVPERDSRQDSVLYGPVTGALPAAWDFVSTHLPAVRSMSDRLGAQARQVIDEN